MMRSLKALLFTALTAFMPLAVQAQGTIPVALTQQITSNGQPMAGCLLYLFQTGTVSTPIGVFSDTGLSQTLPNPLPCDQNGRLPMFYLASGTVHPRLTDASGIVQFDVPNMLVIGPAGGGGGGGGVDPTTILATGDVKFRPTTEVLSGFIKLNGTTIGNGSSGATQLASSTAQNLYVYLWTNCSQPSSNAHCVVSGGLGASALADFNASKTLTVLDWRSRSPVGLADMGSSNCSGVRVDCIVAGNVTSGGTDGVTTPAATGGNANNALLAGNIPSLSVGVSVSDSRAWAAATGGGTTAGSAVSWALGSNAGSPLGVQQLVEVTGGSITASGSYTNGSPSKVNGIGPFMLGTWYQKL